MVGKRLGPLIDDVAAESGAITIDALPLALSQLRSSSYLQYM